LARRGAVTQVIVPTWEIAEDDQSGGTPADDSHLSGGYPCHLHTQFEVNGQSVHIDRTWANLWGPGRSKVEWHIFVDGRLAGVVGKLGCSLGFTMSIEPAVALLTHGQALVVTNRPVRGGIGLENVLAIPDAVTVEAVDEA